MMAGAVEREAGWAVVTGGYTGGDGWFGGGGGGSGGGSNHLRTQGAGADWIAGVTVGVSGAMTVFCVAA